MGKGLYELLGGGKGGDISSKTIDEFLDKNPSIDIETKGMLLTWRSELEFWKGYGIDVGVHAQRTYRNSPTYISMYKAVGELINPKEGDIWLDAGCGALAMSDLIIGKNNKVSKVYATDIILKPANDRISLFPDHANVELKYASLTDSMPFPDNFFNGIAGNCVFTFVVEHQGRTGKDALIGVFREMYRILKPGGTLVWTTPRKDASNFSGFMASIWFVLNPYWSIKLRRFVPSDMAKILKYTKQIVKKGKKGVYNILTQSEYDELLSTAGFVGSSWVTSFGGQGWVNKCHK